MERSFDPQEPEWMDRDQPVNADLRNALRDLAWMNRWLGANALLWRYVAPLFTPGAELRILDLATGGADIPRFLARKARKCGCTVHIDAVDFHPATTAMARELCAGYPEITLHQGNALTWSPTPGTPQSGYDLVICTLALHHFSREDAVAVLANMQRLTRGAALVLDLERTRFNVLLIELLTRTLIRNPMTVHDARASIRRAFSIPEMRELSMEAGWSGMQVSSHMPCRLTLWMRR